MLTRRLQRDQDARLIEDRLTALDIHGFSPVRKFLREVTGNIAL